MNFEEISINEADFFAKQTSLIEILPNFYEESISFISGTYGPFKPNKPVEIPLWLGIYLKQRNLCRIIPPDFLNCESLGLILEEEKTQKEILSDLPSSSHYYFEICHILLRHASDDLQNSSKIRDLLEDIESIREAKIQDILNKIKKEDEFLKANNMTFYEINKRRKVFNEILNQVQMIKNKGQPEENAINNSSFLNSQRSSQI